MKAFPGLMAALLVAVTTQPSQATSPPAPQRAADGKCVTLVRNFWTEVFVGRNAEAARRYITPDYIQHAPPPQPSGENWIALWKGVFATPPSGPGKDFDEAQKDYKTEIVSILGDDKFAVLSAHDSGTYDHGPSTGKSFDSRYTDIFRCSDDRIVEHWFSPYP